MKKLVVWALIIVLLIMQVFVVNMPYAYAAGMGDIVFLINHSVDHTNVYPGQVFTYTFNYSVSTNTVDLVNDIVLEDILPAGVEYVDSTKTSHIDRVDVDSSGSQTVVQFVFNGVTTGITGTVQISARYKDDGMLSVPVTVVNNGTISGSYAVPVQSNDTSVTVTPKPDDWSVDKQITNPPTTPAVGYPVTYRIDVHSNSSGGVKLQNVLIVDTLPTGAEFVSASNAGVYNAVDGTVTWPATDIPVNASVSRYVTATYSSPAFDATSSVTNTVNVSALPYGATQSTSLSDAVSHGFSLPDPQLGNFSKSNRQSPEEYYVGQSARFGISGASNAGNVPLDNFSIEDDIPGELDLTSVSTGAYSGGTTVAIEYQTKDISSWTSLGIYNASSNSTQTMPGLDANDYFTKVRWSFGTVPIGFSQTSSIIVIGTIRNKDRLNNSFSTVTNNATLTAQSGAVNLSKNSSASFNLSNTAQPWLDPSKTVVGSDQLDYNDRVTFTLTLKNHDYATGTLTNPIAMDVLPLELEAVQFEGWSSGTAQTAAAPATSTSIKTIGAKDFTVLKWDFTGTTLAPGQYVTATFSAKIINLTTVGWITNNYYMTTNSTSDIKQSSGLLDDTNDLDGDSQTDDKLAPASDRFFVKFQGALESSKWLKGQLDTGWGRYPINGFTLPGGLADYQLHIKNSGSNGTISHVVAIDVLPFVGDRGIIDTSARGSQWRPYLVNQITGEGGAPLPFAMSSHLKVYYSTNASPSYSELWDPQNNTGSVGDNWSLTPPADITSVRSIKFDFGDYNLAKGDEIIVEWPMRAPVNAPEGQIAWNVFAYGATYEGPTGQLPFLPAQPAKVGFTVQNDHPFNLGDRVWLDNNGNGIQDAGELGINSVLVNLYDAADNFLGYTRSGNDFAGSPGWYEFPNLVAEEYQAEFVFPDTYYATQANAGGDTLDSDLDPTVIISGGGFKKGKVSVTLGPSNMNVDLGLYKPAAVGNKVWNDYDGNGRQDGAEPAISGVTVHLTDTSGNSVTDINGNAVGPDITDVNGLYSFNNLKPGSYKLKFELPDVNYVFSPPKNAGTNSSNDSNALAGGWTDVFSLASGQTDNTWDAGMNRAALGNFIWHDLNANGIQDGGEPGIAGATVTLYLEGGSLVNTTTTDSNGFYYFRDLVAGRYYITVQKPAGYESYVFTTENFGADSADSDVDTAGQSGIVDLEAGELDWTLDGGLYKNVNLGNFVWEDLNANGVQDAGEPGIGNVTVNLYRDAGRSNLIGAATTDLNGAYGFSNLQPGSYWLEFILSDPSLKFTSQDRGSDSTDSDAASDGTTSLFNLVSANDDMTRDAGVYQTASLGDTVWEDRNHDGLQTAGEGPVPNVQVHLLNSLSQIVRDASLNPIVATTDGNGKYLFDTLVPGVYRVSFDLPSGYMEFSSQNALGNSADTTDSDVNAFGLSDTVTLASGQNDRDLDAGVAMYTDLSVIKTVDPLSVLNGQTAKWTIAVTNNGPNSATGVSVSDHLPSEAVYLSDNAGGTYDNTSGIWMIGSLGVAQTRTIEITTRLVKDGSITNTATVTGNELDAVAANNIGEATINAEKLVDLVVEKTADKTIWSGSQSITYTIKVTNRGPNDATNVVLTDAMLPNCTYEWDDALGAYNPNTGKWTIGGLGAGASVQMQFRVKPISSQDVHNTAVAESLEADANPADNQDSFVVRRYVPPQYASVGNRVWLDANSNGIQDAVEAGKSGVTVSLCDPSGRTLVTTTTDASGYYLFANLTPGNYSIRFSIPEGYAITKSFAGLDYQMDSNSDRLGFAPGFALVGNQVDLSWDLGLCTLTPVVIVDVNHNGIPDEEEQATAGNSLPQTAAGYYRTLLFGIIMFALSLALLILWILKTKYNKK